jgi:hypothetical protein
MLAEQEVEEANVEEKTEDPKEEKAEDNKEDDGDDWEAKDDHRATRDASSDEMRTTSSGP